MNEVNKMNNQAIPRPEYPRPQFVRDNWQNLNGEWEFFNDHTREEYDKNMLALEKLQDKIIVPFCVESVLSGIGDKRHTASLWYAKNLTFTKAQLDGRILLHIGACDYSASVYVNGVLATTHQGGYTPISIDITEFAKEGENRVIIHAMDDTRSWKIPSGKQAPDQSEGCAYTRTSGIWQTVWLEFLPKTYLTNVKITATDLSGAVVLEPTLNAYAKNAQLKVSVTFNGKSVANKTFSLSGKVNLCTVEVSEVRLWEAGAPNLYDIHYTLLIDGKETDSVQSYFGIRRIDIDGKKVLINGKSVFQRLVLDQGYYPDGIYTAPSAEALKKDILLAQRLGFNGARLHQKVFEPWFLYYADKLGYLVWGEYANWFFTSNQPDALAVFLPEWMESVERDYNHPSIIGWCPFNETWEKDEKKEDLINVALVALATKKTDPTRPVIDSSGWHHSHITDVYDSHDYTQDVEAFDKLFTDHQNGTAYYSPQNNINLYDGKMPYFVSEYGGISWWGNREMSKLHWGYGSAPKTEEEFVARYCGLAKVLLDKSNIFGLCYTQLYDIEQEQNGLYYYDRMPKFSDEVHDKLRDAMLQKAAIED